MLKCLLRDSNGCVRIEYNENTTDLKVCVDRSLIRTHGKPALGKLLLRLHMYRCTADVQSCRAFYEDLSSVDGEYLAWQKKVVANRPKHLLYCFANTFASDTGVVLRQYPATLQGILESWMQRDL